MNIKEDVLELKSYKKEFWIATCIYFVVMIATFMIGWFVFGRDEIYNMLMSTKETIEKSGLSEGNPAHVDMLLLFLRNTWVSFVLIALGFIPFGLGTAFILSSNGSLMGFVLLAGEVIRGNAFEMFVFGILPHGITEVGAFLIASALGFRLTRSVSRKIRKKELDEPISLTFKRSARIFFVVIVPLILVSALLEAYVTPVLLDMFT